MVRCVVWNMLKDDSPPCSGSSRVECQPSTVRGAELTHNVLDEGGSTELCMLPSGGTEAIHVAKTRKATNRFVFSFFLASFFYLSFVQDDQRHGCFWPPTPSGVTSLPTGPVRCVLFGHLDAAPAPIV